LGSIRATVLDSAGAPVIGYDDYDPWGYPLALRTKAIPNAYLQGASDNKFTGKEYDDELGLNLLHFDWRLYDPQIGRFVSVDPQADDFPSHSPYHYAYNNPLAFNDPTGQSGEAVVETDSSGKETGNVIVSANLIFYGSQATSSNAKAIASEIQNLYNAAGATITINGKQYTVKFNITHQVVSAGVAAILAKNNADIKNNFIRVENQGTIIRSQMENLEANAGFFVTSDNLGRSTTAAHEFGHGLGLPHSSGNQIGQGQPDIMAARGTLVDPQFQYNPSAQPGAPGGTLNPIFRAVLQRNISDVFVNVHFTNGIAKIGTLTNTIYK
jgi:RHS repeat-associated protein